MNQPFSRNRKTMRDVTSSLVGSSFRRVQQDGRVTFARKIKTPGQLSSQTGPSARVRRTDAV